MSLLMGYKEGLKNVYLRTKKDYMGMLSLTK